LSVDANVYSLRAAVREDLPMLRRWLESPEVVRWWGEPEEPLMTMRIVLFRCAPFAYAQDYGVDSWPQPHFEGLPPGARAIDAFIGEPDMIGRGHGPVFLRLLAQRLIDEGAPLVAIDPDTGNLRARRAYAAAGFVGDAVVETGEGPAVLMVFTG
jgi:aminoglycoside 6'-N-acetyltransferase